MSEFYPLPKLPKIALKENGNFLFFQCVKIMRPAQKYMRKLVQCDDLSSTDSLRHLLKIGDHINGHLGKISLTYSLNFLSSFLCLKLLIHCFRYEI